ncbi:phage tail sheath subtilisin-like domain-containing protein [Streptomyces yaizuensis]|uniref:Phage tail sheath subtilisin-like domain-containing protein n=1 Tax=Streptomyces yaizuensis TaxID=2989713 RepID=A0ABQ5NT81_9ACTN|nr:phage tail sheath subtilisin-like domain-containing protein [Streptomyces sp. YSPA8]GLF93384.1 phage tail sheath subtilisin-like domain-containing protein [Streptomyces sp. YSPA8]
MTTEALPGVSLTFVPRGSDEEPLRTDVAAFLGRFRRGPAGVPVRVESWRDVLGAFGAPDGASAAPYAVRGFFENGGRTAWLLRVTGPGAVARAEWAVGDVGGFAARRYTVVATSPGAWANGARVGIRFRSSTVAGPPTVDVRVTVPGEPPESFPGLAPGALEAGVAASRLVRLVPGGPPPAPRARVPITLTWELTLTGGVDRPPDRGAYAAAVARQATLPEPALVALPDLGADLSGADHRELVRELLVTVRPLLDRLVVLDVPPGLVSVDEAVAFARELDAPGEDLAAATAAVYHPPLLVPEGTGARTVPASGHVLGVIARLDAERGAHHTPANAVLLEAVDLAVAFPVAQQVRLVDAGIDLLRCTRGRGLVVWGGRTLSTAPDLRYIAHRRLLHLLVRAIRRVAAPLVFDVNSPELRLTLVRALTSVLLAAFRAGALAGARPEQAFRVVCDEGNNPPGQDPATTVCEVEVAPAVPMEFIRLRLVLGADRGLEVIEA